MSAPDAHLPVATPAPERAEVLIIGAGFGGLGMAIRLKQSGQTDFIVLDRDPRTIGGTWRDNTYPGCACDVPSLLYSFSFAPSADWRHRFGRQAEIQAYLERCTDRFGIRSHIRTGADVVEARFDDDAALWRLRTADGRRFEGRHVVFAVGGLKDPQYPAIPGRERFEGPSLHSARWDADVDLAGKRVGVIGTGASAIQIVPEIAEPTAQLTVFQRTPPWVMPRFDRPQGSVTRWLHRWVPGLQRLKRGALYLFWELRHPLLFRRVTAFSTVLESSLRKHIASHFSDPAEAARLTPDYRIGCKRILLSDDWYPALARPDVTTESRAITEIEPDGVRLADGEHLPLDALVYCTGFTVDQPLGEMQVFGRGGRSLTELWRARPRAHLGITVPGLPNAYTLLGPNTALGHTSVLVMIEAQIGFILRTLSRVRRRGARWVDTRPEALERYVTELDAAHVGTVWSSGCDSWYLDRGRQNYTLWPHSTLAYRARLRRFAEADYEFG